MKIGKLNNQGFAISGILYPIFILFLILLFGVVGNLSASKAILDKNKKDVEATLNGDNVNPYFVFDGNDVTISNGYAYTLTSGVKAYTADGKEIGSENISYVSSPTFSNTANGIYTVDYTVTDASGKSTIATKIIRVEPATTYIMYYNGTGQAFPVNKAGSYQIELWGAEGSGNLGAGGKGSYTNGIVTLSEQQTNDLKVFVGQGYPLASNSTSFNGGTSNGGGQPGGGATDIRNMNKNSYRYVRNYINGSGANANNHWVEIQVFDKDGVNVALGKPVIGSVPEVAIRPYSIMTDGLTDSASYAESSVAGLQYVEIDLGQEYEISSVNVFHYYADSRVYVATKTMLYSSNRTISTTIFDSAWSGTYAESVSGKISNILLDWNNFESLKARIMVAAGGGAGIATGGAAGGLTGGSGVNASVVYPITYEGFGGTQIAAGLSTYGATTSGFGFSNNGCSGGGGYYGGGGASCDNGGGGGSSFISGFTGCNAINSSSTPGAITHSGTVNHYSGLTFSSTVLSAGTVSMPNITNGTETGHTGNGVARITVLYKVNS